MTAGQWFWTAVIVALFATIVWLILDDHFRELQAGIDLALVDTDDDPYMCADEFAWVADDDCDMPTPLRAIEEHPWVSEQLLAAELANDDLDWTAPAKWIER